MAQDSTTARDDVKAEAARWVVRFASGGLSEAEQVEFRNWRTASVEHEIAFERESLAWERTERLRALRPPHVTGEIPRAAAFLQSGRLRWFSRFSSLRMYAAAVCSLAIVSIGVLLWIDGSVREYATAVGERRIIHLEDGSRLELNTNSKVQVRISDTVRDVKLLNGESLFEVVPDGKRPFTVAVGEDAVRALGTAFSIRRDDEASYKVLVTQGVVEVTGPRTDSAPRYHLRVPAGSAAVHSASGLKSYTMSAAEQERLLAWRVGMISLAGETLAEAAVQFNRYNHRQLVVVDPAIAGLQLGGYFNAHDLDGFAKVLASTFALQAEAVGTEIHLRGTRGTPQLDSHAPAEFRHGVH